MAWTPQYQQRPTQQPQQQAQQMPQQQQYQNPAANWQQTYQNSQWFRPAQYQPNPYQSQMPQQMPQQQMPQQYQQQQMPQFSQQQINSFLNYMRSRPMPNFMGDPRYQAQQAERPVYQPPAQTTARTYVPDVKFIPGTNTMGGTIGGGYTVGDAAADAWVKAKIEEDLRKKSLNTRGAVGSNEEDIRNAYKQYFAGAA
jgi:hypothetical protein